MTWQEEQQAIRDAVARFPGIFGLRAFPGKRFRVSESASHFAFGAVQLYLQMDCEDGWLDFAKGTESELRREVVGA